MGLNGMVTETILISIEDFPDNNFVTVYYTWKYRVLMVYNCLIFVLFFENLADFLEQLNYSVKMREILHNKT